MTDQPGGIVPPPSGQDPRHHVMPPPVRKAANHSSSGVGIIRSFRSRPAFSFAHTANLQEPGSSVTTQALSEDRPLVRAVLRGPRTCFLPTPRNGVGRKRLVGQRKCEQCRPVHVSPRFKVVMSIFAGRVTRARSNQCSSRCRQGPIPIVW